MIDSSGERANTKAHVRRAMPLRRLLGSVVAIVLFFMMILTVVDVAGRFIFAKPVPGSFELMEFALAILIFSAIPLVTWDRAHITVTLFDSLFLRLGGNVQQVFTLGVSAIAMAIICWRMWDQGNRLDVTGAITGYLEWPIAPVAWFMSVLAALSLLILLNLFWLALRNRPLPTFDDHSVDAVD